MGETDSFRLLFPLTYTASTGKPTGEKGQGDEGDKGDGSK